MLKFNIKQHNDCWFGWVGFNDQRIYAQFGNTALEVMENLWNAVKTKNITLR